MSHLIPLIISIVLSSAVAVSAAMYIPVHNVLGDSLRTTLDEGLETFKSAVLAYEAQNRTYSWVEDCPPNAVSGDPTCVFDRKIDAGSGSLDPTGWKATLEPDYMYVPLVPNGFTWSMGRNVDGLYVCLEAPFNNTTSLALQGLITENKGSSLNVGASCPLSTSMVLSDFSSYNNSNIFVTYWVQK